MQIREALLLSLVTIAAAWSGYAAAKWGTESRMELEVVGGAGGEPRPSQRNSRLTWSQPLAIRSAPTRSPGPGSTTWPAAARVAVVEFFCLDLADEGGGEEVVEVAHDHLQGRGLVSCSLSLAGPGVAPSRG